VSLDRTSAPFPAGQKGGPDVPASAWQDRKTLLLADKQQLWRRVQENIKKRLGLPRYGIWFQQTQLMKLDEASLVVGVPNVVVKMYLDQEYKRSVQRAAEDLLGPGINVSFDVDPELLRSLRASQRKDATEGTRPAPPERQSAPELDDRTRAAPPQPGGSGGLERLIVTDANRIPHLAAREIASSANPTFRFLLLLGDYGAGKTVLARAVHKAALENGVAARPHYVMAESWCNDYYEALQSKKVWSFRRRCRGCDMLIVDGIEFVEGKPRGQDELLYTARAVLAAQGRVVFSATVHPDDLQQVTPAFRTLLKGAFWAQLVVPPAQECEEFVRGLADRHGLTLGAEVCRMLAQRHASSVQELAGAVDSLAAYAFLQGRSEVDYPTATQALAQMKRSRTRLPGLKDIFDVVLAVFPVSEAQLKGRSRSRGVCRARQIGMYLARELTGESLSDIGRFFGGRTHSTAKHSVDKIARHVATDQETAQLVERCSSRLRWM